MSTEDEAMKKHIEEQEAKLGNAYQEGSNTESEEVVIEEQESVTSFGKVPNREYEYRQEAHMDVVDKYGWQLIDVNNLPSARKGLLFYDIGFKLMIRAGDTPEVRQWSEIDESNGMSIDEAFNNMLKSCAKVTYGDRGGSYKDILEEDRIYVLLEIRKLTFPEPENELTFKVSCSEGHENDMKLSNDNFRSVEINSTMKKYYNGQEKMFIVKTKTYGEIKIKPPTIGIMQAISTYIADQRQAGVEIDLTFAKILSYISLDWRGLNAKKIKQLEADYSTWSKKKFPLMLKLCDDSRVGIETKMYSNCTSCGVEISADITFPGGIKALFVISDFSDELV